MFMIIPLKAAVRHARPPWVVLVITVLCVGIYLMQDSRARAIEQALVPYCEALHHSEIAEAERSFVTEDPLDCFFELKAIHNLPDKARFGDLMHHWYGQEEVAPGVLYSHDEIEEVVQLVMARYEAVRDDLPSSINAKLLYDPKVPDPIRSLLSALSHADWWHLIGNLIFFLAFAPAIEWIIASAWRFILALVAIELICELAYSLAILLGAAPFPTLGLSGIVFGVIGMGAYLMPNVRIRCFVWIFFYIRLLYIPAAILAIGFIGWDIYSLTSRGMSTGVNLIAHVSAGLAGYFIARFGFRQRREETRDEIDEEVEHMRSMRSDKYSMLGTFRGKEQYLSNTLRQEAAQKGFERMLDMIHEAVNTGNDALAIHLLLEQYDEYRHAIENYEQIHASMLEWRHSRALLCLSRLLIHEYLSARQYAKAIDVAQTAYRISPRFVFAEDREQELLEAIARKQGVSLRG